MKIENGVLIEIENNDIDSDGKCVIPYGITVIGKEAFCRKPIRSVIIPSSVTIIGGEAFKFCRSLSEITIPYSITSIGNYAFDECTSLKEVHISDLTSWCNIDFDTSNANPLGYAHNLYLNKKLIEKLIIPENITVIKKSTFEGGSFKKIAINNNVTDIENYAFYNCNSIKSITIPKNVKTIGKESFGESNSLKTVIIDGILESAGNWTFGSCNNIEKIIVHSEKTKKLLLSTTHGVPGDCKIIVDETLSLGSNYSPDTSVILSDSDKSVTGIKKLKEKFNNIFGSDEL